MLAMLWPDAPSAHAAQPDRATVPRVVLSGTTSFWADRPTAFRLHVPVDVEIDVRKRTLFEPGSDLELRGRGRMTGVVIVDERSRAGELPAFAAIRFRECDRPGCVGGNAPSMKLVVPLAQQQVLIPAGDYEVYMITDAAPVKVTLSIGELAGSATAVEGVPARLDLATPEASLRSTAGPTAYEASHTYSVFGRGALAIGATWARGSAYAGSRHSFCLSNTTGDPPPPARGPLACAPPSLNGGFVGGAGDDLSSAEERASRLVVFNAYALDATRTIEGHPADPKRWTYGFSVTSRGSVDSVGSHALVLTL